MTPPALTPAHPPVHPVLRRGVVGLLGLALCGTAAATAVVPAATPATAAVPDDRPNVVLVIADDLGWSDLSGPLPNALPGRGPAQTPALDRLAAEGLTFTQAYASANCAPSRAALWSGGYAVRPTNNIYQVGDLNRGGSETMLVGPAQGLPTGDDALPPSTVTLGEAMQSAGYATGYVGKFHVTATPEEVVIEHGFDVNLGGGPAGAPGAHYATDGQFPQQVGPELDAYAAPYTAEYVAQNIAPWSSGVSDAELTGLIGGPKHLTDAVTDATLELIDQQSGPFVTVMSHYAVHTPVGDAQARPDLLAKYDRIGDPRPDADERSAPYAALTEGLDQSIARLTDHLRTTEDPRRSGRTLAENTVVVFTSDNGGTHMADNGPLSRTKGELAEGGIRVPIVAWSDNPALVSGGSVSSVPISVLDLYPTVLGWGGAPHPVGQPVDGVDLTALVAGRADDTSRRCLYWHLPGYLADEHRDQRPESVIRCGDWKLRYHYETSSWQLYDLAEDAAEADDRSASEPGVVKSLGQRLIRWLDGADAPLATLREGKDPVELTVSGTVYADGRARQIRSGTVTVAPGEELPLVLPYR